jgi:short-subunit dehydrogenase
MKLSARSLITGWIYAAKVTIKLTRKHGFRGLGSALQEELQDTNVEVGRVMVGAPAVSFDGTVKGHDT